MKRLKLIFILVFLFDAILLSQNAGDSVIYVPISDTVKKNSQRESEIDAIVRYSAVDSIVFDITDEKIYLYNNAELLYRDYKLKAARIILYRESSVMEAYGAEDTSGNISGTPVFYEGSKRYDAFRLKYNFHTRRGTIEMGSTEIEGGFYLGEKIKKVDEKIYFIKDGRYTTCDKTNPDYYFGSPKMKVIQGDKVIAEPVFLYVDDVPVFALPFGIFPNHSGRSSGLIPPAYGEDAFYGRYLSRLGYFWAINDYMDLSLQGNYYTKGRTDLYSRFRYALRYKFQGSVELGGSRIRIGEENDNDKQFSDEWRIALNHSHTIDPTLNLIANVNFLSGKNYYNTSTNNLNDLLMQNAISNITFSKLWEGTPNSLVLNYSRDQNLISGEVRQIIPSLTFTRSQSFPFRTKNTNIFDLKWYEVISYSYNSQLLYRDEKVLANPFDQNGYFIKNNRGGLKQVLNISSPLKVYEFNISPFFNYNEIWYNRFIIKKFNSQDSSINTVEQRAFRTFRYFNTGISFNTRLIGVFRAGFLGILGLRHIITPQVTYSYQPDFSEPLWNAYGSYVDKFGREVKYSYYEKEVFGGAPAGEQQSLNFSVGNIFEIKMKDNDTTDKKFQLLNLNAALSYNFAADSLRFSEIGINYRTQIGNFLNVGGGASFNLYQYIQGKGRINKFLLNEEKKLAQLTSFNISLSTSVQGGELKTSEIDTVEREYADENEYIGIYGDKPADFSIPWNISLSYNYGINKQNPFDPKKFSAVSGNIGFNLTSKWKFTFSAGYDLISNEFSTPYVTIYRDLHCWEMSFNWIPAGLYRGYRFELKVKAPQLHDVKITKQSNYRGVY